MPTFFGYLTHLPSNYDTSDEKINSIITLLVKSSSFDYRITPSAPGDQSRNYQFLSYLTHRPLLSEDLYSGNNTTFIYPIFLAEGKTSKRLVVASVRYEILEHAFNTIRQILYPHPRRSLIDTPYLASTLLDRGESAPYRITHLHLSILGYGNQLTSMSLYGNDIVDTLFLKTLRPQQYVAIGIGLRPKGRETEVARFYQDGRVVMHSERVKEFLIALGYLNKINCLTDKYLDS